MVQDNNMADALTAVAALFTIWAQSSILADNGEFERFKSEEPVQHQQEIDRQRRQIEILQAALDRREQILLANQRVISQTQLK